MDLRNTVTQPRAESSELIENEHILFTLLSPTLCDGKRRITVRRIHHGGAAGECFAFNLVYSGSFIGEAEMTETGVGNPRGWWVMPNPPPPTRPVPAQRPAVMEPRGWVLVPGQCIDLSRRTAHVLNQTEALSIARRVRHWEKPPKDGFNFLTIRGSIEGMGSCV